MSDDFEFLKRAQDESDKKAWKRTAQGLAVFFVGLALCTAFVLYVAIKAQHSEKADKAKPASSCQPAPGQCAYDGYGVYCLLPPDKTPVRNGEPK